MKLAILAFAFLLVSPPAVAHHGNAGYEMQKMTIIPTVMVTKVDWTNPHIQIYFDAKDDKGNVQHWIAEAQNLGCVGWRAQ